MSSDQLSRQETREQIGPQIRPCPGTGSSGPRVDRKHAVECTLACARRGVLVIANTGLFIQAVYRCEIEESIEKLQNNGISSRRGHFQGTVHMPL